MLTHCCQLYNLEFVLKASSITPNTSRDAPCTVPGSVWAASHLRVIPMLLIPKIHYLIEFMLLVLFQVYQEASRGL